MGGNAEENTAFRPSVLAQGRKAFVFKKKKELEKMID